MSYDLVEGVSNTKETLSPSVLYEMVWPHWGINVLLLYIYQCLGILHFQLSARHPRIAAEHCVCQYETWPQRSACHISDLIYCVRPFSVPSNLLHRRGWIFSSVSVHVCICLFCGYGIVDMSTCELYVIIKCLRTI